MSWRRSSERDSHRHQKPVHLFVAAALIATFVGTVPVEKPPACPGIDPQLCDPGPA